MKPQPSTQEKQILCIRLLNWPIDRLRRQRARARRHEGENPLVLVRTVATRQLIVATDESAHAIGIRPTMTLGEARALCATVAHEEHDPARDHKALEALARWMIRFSPIVALPQPWNGRLAHAQNDEPTLYGIFLDLTGCARAFHGLENVVRRIESAMSKMRITSRLALAPTPGAAWAMTFTRAEFAACGFANAVDFCAGEAASGGSAEALAGALKDLPPLALRLDTETIESLHHLGLETIGQILELPRDQLPARFGPLLSLRIDQVLGRINEPLVPLEPPVAIRARMDFDGLVESLEAIWMAFKQLIEQVMGQLLRHGRGARELEVEFYRAYATTLRTTIRLSRPSRDAGNLFNLLRCAMETIETDEGFLGIALVVTSSERVGDDQIHLLGGDEFEARIELDHLIERLRVRLGEEIIARPELVESYVPERACTWHGVSFRCAGSLAHAPAARAANAWPGRPCHVEEIRPLHLLRQPIEIRAMVSPSHDRDGRPVLFAHRGQVHRLAHAVGPERIAGQWWQGHFKTRDYFDVEDEEGKRFWIFRVMESGKWFLHGEFE